MTRTKLVRLGFLALVGSALALAWPSVAGAQDVYRVTLRAPGAWGLASDCPSGTGQVLAEGAMRATGGTLKADGQALEPDGTLGPPLFLNLVTDVPWTRKYDAGRGLAGTFNGCFGETYGTNGSHGALFIDFGSRKGKSFIHFTWHFEYYVTPGNVIREHFTLTSADIPFPAWNLAGVSGRVKGTFDIGYYLKEGRKILSGYESITGGAGRYFEFDLVIQKVQ